MGKRVSETVSITTQAAEAIAAERALYVELGDCAGISRTGQTVCVAHTYHQTPKTAAHGGFSGVTSEYRVWGRHRG